MLSLPAKFKKDANVAKVTFVRGGGLTGADKKRFETAVKDIRLTYQIEGFDIPNLVNDEYNCQVIMFLRITLTTLKQAQYVAAIVQKYINPLCVIEFTDGVDEQYSFADKRLNKQDTVKWYNEQSYIILDDEFLQYDPPVRGIYGIFLGKDGPEICVYVGKSENVYRRMFKDDGHLVRMLMYGKEASNRKQ